MLTTNFILLTNPKPLLQKPIRSSWGNSWWTSLLCQPTNWCHVWTALCAQNNIPSALRANYVSRLEHFSYNQQNCLHCKSVIIMGTFKFRHSVKGFHKVCINVSMMWCMCTSPQLSFYLSLSSPFKDGIDLIQIHRCLTWMK